VFRRAGVVTACSRDLADRAIALGAAPDRVEVVPYGVDVRRFRPDPAVRTGRRAAIDVRDTDCLVFAAGRLVRKKGFEYLVDAMARLETSPRVVLALAGQGDLDAELRARAAEGPASDRIRFLGNQTQDEIASWMAAADIVAAPSVRDDSGNVDGLPNVVLEALASGTALVTTAAGGIGSIVEDARTALVVPERDAGALAAAIQSLVADPDLRTRLGAAARLEAETRLGWPDVARRFDAAYARSLALAQRQS
jgi:glycosyltransferase involved in cell wall biosynthesis